MKLQRLFNISACFGLLIGATACSSDYLSLEPEGTLKYSEMDNEQGATLAINALCSSMYKQYAGIDDGSLGFNGEPEMLQYYGEVFGQDYVSTYWILTGSTFIMNWGSPSAIMNDPSGSQPAWGYLYGLIGQANNILTSAPKVKDEAGNVVEDENFNFNPVPDVDGRYAFRYAQALTMRAHAYIRLMQIYCSRYEQRYTTSGEWSLTVPLRLEYKPAQDDLNCPLATWDELVRQIYADLGQAIQIYEDCGMNREYNWEPDKSIAQGLFSRIAMINHDWSTAREMAKAARANYPIMSGEDYQNGFANPTSEWMWSNSGEAQGMYYFSFGATYACNGAYPCRWGTIGAGGINNDLLNDALKFYSSDYASSNVNAQTVAVQDYRIQLYFAPITNPIYRRDFWDAAQVTSETMNINTSTGNLHKGFVAFCEERYKPFAEKGWDAPYTYSGYPVNDVTTVVSAVFGAQFKFWGYDNYSSSHFPFMRASELLLTEAEAAYEMNDESAANELLKELNTKRFTLDRYGDSRYVYTYNGNDLLDAIKYYRRLELWGEGFSFFDYKRWDQPIVRTAWDSSDTNSGNWPGSYAGTIGTDASNGWRFRIPLTEINYNSDINRAQAGYDYDW